MVHWVYVLECEDDYLYIGETTRLYTRFNEHLTGRGGSNTVKHKPYKLIGLYKVNDNHSFMKYRNAIKAGEYNKFILEDWDKEGDNLLIENHITQRYLYERRENDFYGGGLEWYKIRGGKYTRQKMDETVALYKWASEKEGGGCIARNPIDSIPVNSIVDRPQCDCDYPSEVKLSNDKLKVYFVCALRNVWKDLRKDFSCYLNVEPACDFYELYNEDREVKEKYEIIKRISIENWLLNVPLSNGKFYNEPCISCNKTDYLPIFNTGKRRLCQNCILTNYTILKERYDSVCLISDD